MVTVAPKRRLETTKPVFPPSTITVQNVFIAVQYFPRFIPNRKENKGKHLF